MARVKVVAFGSTVLLLLAAVTWSALPPRTSSPPPSVPDPLVAAHEPAGVPHATGRAVPGRSGGSLLEKVFAFVVPAATTEPTPVSPDARWTVLTVPVDGGAPAPSGQGSASRRATSTKAAIAERALAFGAIPPRPELEEPVTDPDADWYAEAPDDGHAGMTYAEANPGRARVPRRLAVNLPRRDAGGLDWYDNLGARETRATPERGLSIDALVPELGVRGDSIRSFDASGAAGTPRRGRTFAASGDRSSERSERGGGARRDPGRADPSADRFTAPVACTSGTTRYRLVKLVPSTGSPADPPLRGAAPIAHGLPAPYEPEPAIVVASLGPRLPGTGTVAYPGLTTPLPESTPKAAPFCPLGTVEKKTKGERWCTRADRGGVSFREGPVAFLFANGKKRAEGTYVNGILQGAFVEYTASGRKVAEGAYRDGKKSGAWTFWWDDGKKQSQGTYVAGERSGLWTYYDEKGRKTSHGELRTVGNVEKKQGRWTWWHPNGTKSQEGAFREGRKDGAWKTFDENGRQVSTLLWREGEEQ